MIFKKLLKLYTSRLPWDRRCLQCFHPMSVVHSLRPRGNKGFSQRDCAGNLFLPMICEEIFTIKEPFALWMLYDHSDEDSCPPKRSNILWPNREFWSVNMYVFSVRQSWAHISFSFSSTGSYFLFTWLTVKFPYWSSMHLTRFWYSTSV